MEKKRLQWIMSFATIILWVSIFCVMAECASTRTLNDNPRTLDVKNETDHSGWVFSPVEDKSFNGALYKLMPPGEEPPENLMSKPKELLVKFIDNLKRYLAGHCFAVDQFEKDAEDLKAKLLGFRSTVDKVYSSRKKVLKQLEFATHMFDTMVDSIEPLKHYEFMGRADLHLVNRMIDHRVKLLKMYDPQGEPDFLRLDFEAAVFRNTIMRDFWKEQFDSLSGVGIGVKLVFDCEVKKTDGVLSELRNYMAKKD